MYMYDSTRVRCANDERLRSEGADDDGAFASMLCRAAARRILMLQRPRKAHHSNPPLSGPSRHELLYIWQVGAHPA